MKDFLLTLIVCVSITTTGGIGWAFGYQSGVNSEKLPRLQYMRDCATMGRMYTGCSCEEFPRSWKP